jgi:hypothetical protein
MPELNLKQIRKDLRLPELRLPEMSRDDIAKALGATRRELREVRRDLNEFRREFEMPRVDLTAVEMPKVDVPKVEVLKVELPKVDMAKVSKDARKGAKQAAQKAGLVARPSRIPFVLVGLVTFGLVAWAMATPGVKTRVREATRQARERMAERRSAWDLDDETRAFDVTSPADVTADAYGGSIDSAQSSFGELPTSLPEGMGAGGATHTIQADEPART